MTSPPLDVPAGVPRRGRARTATRVVLFLALLGALVAAAVLGVRGAGRDPGSPPEVGLRERDVDPTGGGAPPVGALADSVTVFYATDRARFAPDLAWYARRFLPALLVLGVALVLAGRLRRLLRPAFAWRARVVAWGGVLVAIALAVHGGVRALRMAQTAARLAVQYGNERLDVDGRPGLPVETGLCQVTIPPSHVLGEVERPSLWKGDLFEDPRRHMVVHDVRPLEEAPWFVALRDVVAGSDAQDAFVFVHGYNVSFEEAVLRTAQIAYDLRFRGAPICWSWPSQGGLAQYTVDEANVRWATAHLERFLLALSERAGARRIHLIAHSMGNRALTETLQRLRDRRRDGAPLFDQVVLAAPDVDADTFRDDIAPAMLPTSARVTLYASSRDAALQLSRRIHGYRRAGEAGDSIVVVPGMDTVDVSEVSGSHSYIGNSGRVLDDLGATILRRATREGRADLVARTVRGARYWLLRTAGR